MARSASEAPYRPRGACHPPSADAPTTRTNVRYKIRRVGASGRRPSGGLQGGGRMGSGVRSSALSLEKRIGTSSAPTRPTGEGPTAKLGYVDGGPLSTGRPEKRSVVITSVQLYVMSEPT